MKNTEVPRSSIDDVRVVETRGPWKSKSGGELDVLFGMPRVELEAFLDVDNPAFDDVIEDSGFDIRGLRSYTVTDIPAEAIGGKEWHRARTEMVAAIGGSALWLCVDTMGNEREVVLDGSKIVIQPPGIMHTYKALENNTGLLVICNTLFNPEDPRTHDTFPQDIFPTHAK